MIAKLGSPLRRERFLSLNRGDRSSPMEERRPVRHLVLRGSARFEEMQQHGGAREGVVLPPGTRDGNEKYAAQYAGIVSPVT